MMMMITMPTVDASDGEKKLHANLFANYNKEVRPLHDPKHTVEIELEFDLNHLKKIVCNFF